MDPGRKNEYQEFTESVAQLDKGLRSITAMLNKHDEATVYLGVKAITSSSSVAGSMIDGVGFNRWSEDNNGYIKKSELWVMYYLTDHGYDFQSEFKME